jgi:hypothetical protein
MSFERRFHALDGDPRAASPRGRQREAQSVKNIMKWAA